MEHYKLYIDTGNAARTHRDLTALFGIQPEKPVDGAEDPHSLWTYYCRNEGVQATPCKVDFLLDLLVPKFEALEKLGISRHQVTLACFYDCERHSAIDLSPAQLRRLGDSGICFSIDAWPSGIGQLGSRA